MTIARRLEPRFLLEPAGWLRPIVADGRGGVMYAAPRCRRCDDHAWQLSRWRPYYEYFSMREKPYPGAETIRAALA